MKKQNIMKIIGLLFLSISNLSFGQEFIQLIGLDVDSSEFTKGSYAVMYDSTDQSKSKFKGYFPLKTIGIHRKNNKVTIYSLNYLLIPTKKGFIYGTLDNKEEKYNPQDYDDFLRERFEEYKLGYSETTPKFFKNSSEIIKFMKHQSPSFDDALSIDFKKISFINPNFYITKGFVSEVHGGATWFNAREGIDIYPIDWNGKKLSTKITHYLGNKAKNKIVINTLKTIIYLTPNEKIDSSYTLPWGSSINEHEFVYFNIEFGKNGMNIIPFPLLNGNSARSFLAKGKPIKNKKIYNDLKIKQSETRNTNKKITFISPDKTTKIIIDKNKLKVIDIKTNKLLKKLTINHNKVIMSEFAAGRHVDNWLAELTVL